MKKSLFALFFICVFSAGFSYAQNAMDIYPTNWWVGMKNPNLQLLVHSKNIGTILHAIKFAGNTKKIADGVRLREIHTVENPDYVLLDLIIDKDAKPGKRTFNFIEPGYHISITYEFKERRTGNGTLYAQGVTSKDFIYLLMPDRFSDGDILNDRFSDMNDTACNRKNPFLRHGGDLQGIINHLDYFNDLGVTALWLTPVVENNTTESNENGTMRSSYHGYHFTDQYKIDKRFGGNEAYKKMIDAAHAKGLKIIQDAVYNHIGNTHFIFKDAPAKDWLNEWPSYTNTSYKDQPLVDAYASQVDKNVTVKGWFTPFLPDLNQANPYVANFLIQHAIWTVEEFGIDGWRVDTYFYSDRNFLNNVNKALYAEYPHLTIFGETTMQSVTEQAYYCDNTINTSWKSNLQGVTDFQWQGSTLASLNEDFGWSNGIMRLYNVLVQDILYKDPLRNCIFLDNHDQNRFYSVVGENFDKYKTGIGLLLTQRGIPQLYYGTEILMKNFMDPTDAEVRKDFPGGWEGDSENKFLSSGRTAQENEAYNYVKAIANFRRHSQALQTGAFMQYVPVNGVYVYFRYNASQTIMCVANTSNNNVQIDCSKYAERTKNFSTAVDIINNISFNTSAGIPVAAHSFALFQLNK